MTKDVISSMQIPVCKVFSSNGFQIEHMPDFLSNEEFDNYAPHTHSFYEVLWFQQGTGVHTVDFQEYAVQPNTIFFLTPGQIHHFDHNGYTGLSIKMCTDFMKSEDCQCSSFIKYNVFHNFDSTPCFQIDDETAAELSSLVQSMEKEAQMKQAFGNMDMLHSLMRMFLINVYRHGAKEGVICTDERKSSHQLFVRFRSMVESEYQHMHSVQDYAEHLHASVRTLNKCVNDFSGLSPLSFINARIILEAKRMVRYSRLRIKEIAFALGYDDPSYFVRMFKRHTGMMPSEFREADDVIIS